MTFRTASFTNSSALTSTGSSGHIKIISDAVELAANLVTPKPGGVVTIAPRSPATAIDLGQQPEPNNHLALKQSELLRVTAGTLRIGEAGGTNSGTINISAAINPMGTDRFTVFQARLY
jgi:hypothetical protein